MGSVGSCCCNCAGVCTYHASRTHYECETSGLPYDYLFDIVRNVTEGFECYFGGADCGKTDPEILSSFECDPAWGPLPPGGDFTGCGCIEKTCRSPYSYTYTLVQTQMVVKASQWQQILHRLEVTLRPVFGSTTSLRIQAIFTYKALNAWTFRTGVKTRYTPVTINCPSTRTYGTSSFLNLPTAPDARFPPCSTTFPLDAPLGACGFDYTDPVGTGPSYWPLQVVGTRYGTTCEPESGSFVNCTNTGPFDVFSYEPIWYHSICTFVNNPIAGSFGASADTIREFSATYNSDPFECTAFPTNPILMKRTPYTDIAGGTVITPVETAGCPIDGYNDVYSRPAIPREFNLSLTPMP